jgi:hypothetical protein
LKRNRTTFEAFAENAGSAQISETQEELPNRDLDLLASIDLLSRDPKNLECILDLMEPATGLFR